MPGEDRSRRSSTTSRATVRKPDPNAPLRRVMSEKGSSIKIDYSRIDSSSSANLNLESSDAVIQEALSVGPSRRASKCLLNEVSGYLKQREVNPLLNKIKEKFQKEEESKGSVSQSPEIQTTHQKSQEWSVEESSSSLSGKRFSITGTDGHLRTPTVIRSQRNSVCILERIPIDKHHITISRISTKTEEGLSPLLLAARLASQVQIQQWAKPFIRLRGYARSVLIFLRWFKYLGRNLAKRVEWDWSYDPRTYVEYNPFTRNNSEAETRDMHELVSSLKATKYNGVLTEATRNILRKEPHSRTLGEIDNLMTFFSTMKSFEKYDQETRRLFVTNGRYGRWGVNRHIIKERHPAESFYVVLEGQIEIWLLDKRFYDSSKTSVTQYSKILDGSFDPSHKVTISKLGGGAAFGEVAFTQAKDKKRGACVSTLKETEFLYIENKDAKSILKVNTDRSLIDKVECIERLPLFKTLRIDAKTLAYYSTLKVIGVDTPLLTEGEKSDFIYVIKSGSCRVLKTVQVQKKGKVVDILTNSMRGGLKHLMGHEKQTSNTAVHLIVLGELEENDFFGQELGRDTSGISVVTNRRCEVILVPKDDVFRFSTPETWIKFAEAMERIKLDGALDSYEKQVKWAETKRAIIVNSISENNIV